MAVDFLKYKYQDGIVYDEKKVVMERFGLGVRHVQMVYMFSCLAVMYLVRCSTGLAVMAMTDRAGSNDTSIQIFEWNKKTQATIFSSFYFGYTLMMVPAEMCSKNFNGKYILFFVLLVNGFLCIAQPIVASKGGWIAVSNAHLLMGMTQSCLLPAIQLLIDKWVPPHERSLLGAFVYSGVHIGTILSLPLTSLFAESALRWNMIYYVWAMVVLSMAVMWCSLTAATPAQHPAAGDKEKEYVEESLRNHKVAVKNPWRDVLKAKPFWALVAAHVGYQIVYVLFLFGIPMYFRSVLLISTKDIGWCSTLPFIMMWMINLTLFPTSGDVYKNTILSYVISVSYYRKLLNTTGAFGVILGLTVLSALSHAHRTLAVTIAIVTLASTAFQFSGFLENHGDAVPQYSGTILFMTSFLANVAGSMVPLLIGVVLDMDLGPEAQWRIIFLSMATMCVVCNALYVAFGSSDKLTWNGYSFRANNSSEQNKFVLQDMTQTNIGYNEDDF